MQTLHEFVISKDTVTKSTAYLLFHGKKLEGATEFGEYSTGSVEYSSWTTERAAKAAAAASVGRMRMSWEFEATTDLNIWTAEAAEDGDTINV